MANNAPNLKVKATMDNSDIKKRSKESKEALRDFQKTGTDAVNRLGEAFGVNTGKINQMMSAVRGLGENWSKSGNTGVAALGNLLKGVNGLSAGLAGIGIAGLVAGVKALNDEAQAFKNTAAGLLNAQGKQLKFYADALCITPRYLSRVVKECTGSSAADWIERYVVLEARALLKSTSMTIQQISDELNFPSQTFFGKYFKRRVGMSPKDYRRVG